MICKDLIVQLPPITPHTAPEIAVIWQEDVGDWHGEFGQELDALLKHEIDNRTVKVLRAFMDNLPFDGQLVLLSEIRHQARSPWATATAKFLGGCHSQTKYGDRLISSWRIMC